jgi:hypothetical protein
MFAASCEAFTSAMTTATTRSKRTKTTESPVADDKPPIRRAYKVAAGLSIDVVTNPTFDAQAMSATAVISTPTIDRVGDLLMPQGCRLDNYRKNPVVLWNHGFECTTPIGKAVDPSGNLSVRITDQFVESTSYFSQTLREAAQIFELIVEGIVKATSVRETPIVSSYKRDPEFGEILLVEEWELEEWSWVPVGCNPDAVAKALHRGKLAGSAISDTVLKSLMAIAPTLKRPGKGLDLEATEMAKKSYRLPVLKAMDDAELEAAKADADPDSMPMIDEEQKRRKAEGDPPADDKPVVEDESVEDDGDANTPYGAQLLTAIHASLADAVGNIEAGLGPLENPEVKAALSDLVGVLTDAKTSVEGLYSGSYPEGKGLKMDGEPDAEGETLKSFLQAGRLPQLQIDGIGSRLKSLTSAKNLQPAQRRVIVDVIKGLGRMVSQAKAAKAPAKTPQPSAEDAAQMKRITDSIKELDSLVPAAK